MQDIWMEFWRLFNTLGESDVNRTELKEDCKKRVKLFLRVYQTTNVTPYVQSLVYHVPEFIEAYGNINSPNKVWKSSMI